MFLSGKPGYAAPGQSSVPAADGWACVLQTDFGYFGPPEEHFQWTQEEREATYITPEDPSSEICGEVAAAFAASSLALKDTGGYQTCPSSDTRAVFLSSPQRPFL